MTAVAALGFQSCTDWDDHYDVTTDGSGVSDQTLWEQISNNPKLSNFAALMKRWVTTRLCPPTRATPYGHQATTLSTLRNTMP